ncbi:MAG: hypothetical protein ACNA8L_06240 [Luteolibacter sp.]|jgi:hypothetical protein
MTREEIIEKIRKVEALYAGSGVAGEVGAAAEALARLKARLDDVPEEKVEYKISLPDPWKRQLFLALVRRHGLYPYRMPRQRHATVMVRVAPSTMDKILWPEFQELSKLLHAYLNEATRDIISRAVHGDLSEAVENPGLPGM